MSDPIELDERRTRIAQHLERINEMMRDLKRQATAQELEQMEVEELLRELHLAQRNALAMLGIWLAVAATSGAALYWGLFY